MKITAIEEQKKHKNRKSVFLDGIFAFGIDAFSLYALKLKVGDELSPEELITIKKTVLYEDAKNRAIKLVSARSYTKKSIYAKVYDYCMDASVTERVLAFLEEYRLIDDADYARRFASDCIHLKKLGKRAIRTKLREKGISPELADEVLSELIEPATTQENLQTLLLKKLNGNFEFKNIMKAKRYLITKGYGFDEIDSAISRLKTEGEEWS